MLPQFKVDFMSKKEKKDGKPRWAKAVIEFREPFYTDVEPEPTSASEFCKAMMIALQFGTVWFLPVLANLLALRRRREQDPGILGRISILFSEVQQFKEIVDDINQDYCVDCTLAFLRSMNETEELVGRLTAIKL
ncbi:uncharacterized protein J7T54_005054 [Emericellopsis cladophorae]|uniref:Uncharacterized protein n=1 Tax=Emericellopsis cladophorae TaxID=2686198 RepID=A0A9P9XW46_9HYPO|nr:uncharacterized protein J7T54_005054 [Emericellopsis cladophorae]KAI6778530.1 hypothetical protein J7T54_005054 [Emericellopsis cladophorae]